MDAVERMGPPAMRRYIREADQRFAASEDRHRRDAEKMKQELWQAQQALTMQNLPPALEPVKVTRGMQVAIRSLQPEQRLCGVVLDMFRNNSLLRVDFTQSGGKIQSVDVQQLASNEPSAEAQAAAVAQEEARVAQHAMKMAQQECAQIRDSATAVAAAAKAEEQAQIASVTEAAEQAAARAAEAAEQATATAVEAAEQAAARAAEAAKAQAEMEAQLRADQADAAAAQIELATSLEVTESGPSSASVCSRL